MTSASEASVASAPPLQVSFPGPRGQDGADRMILLLRNTSPDVSLAIKFLTRQPDLNLFTVLPNPGLVHPGSTLRVLVTCRDLAQLKRRAAPAKFLLRSGREGEVDLGRTRSFQVEVAPEGHLQPSIDQWNRSGKYFFYA